MSSAEDVAMLKHTVTKQKAVAEAQLAASDGETSTMEALLQETQTNIVDLVGAWKKEGLEQRHELAWSPYPEGLRFGRETSFFEPSNVLLMNTMRERIDDLVAGKNIGVGDGN
jgi:hypothetical protein